jgi:hypothetical protein
MNQLASEHNAVIAIRQKYGHTLIGVLRDVYGPGFANDAGNERTLSDALPEMDDRSLKQLVEDFEAGRLDEKLAAT